MNGIGSDRYLLNERAVERAPDGQLLELEPWSPQRAVELAAEEGIDMGVEHWEVILFLRERFIEEGQARSGRALGEILEQRYAAKGGRRYLYTLFPHGPVGQGSRIAGLPLPAYTADPSFGSSG